MLDFDFSILQCPITRENLTLISREEANKIASEHELHLLKTENISEGFINESSSYFYPVYQDIILLLPVYAVFIGNGQDIREKMAFDKKRVFEYYNELNYFTKDSFQIYEDSPRWVDFRDISTDYIQNSFTRAKKYINPNGKYLLDIASGPIGLKEYIELSENFEVRICADISAKALIQAKHNYRQKKGIFICADISNIPLKDNICDSVLCQHTLYHLPKNEQKVAVEEMYRVAKPFGPVVIIYSLFYHSLFMNLSLFPVQLYRIARHLAGKAYVQLFKSKPRLYFYPHSLGWFRKTFEFGKDMEFYCWRSTNKYFLKIYIHGWLGGRKLLNWLKKSEDNHPEFWAKYGEYPAIVIRKRPAV
jgi:ubiquinone/menaquinone biosynthesis C-methylase UbiE/uncharacterized protein YbaR (Trm112 family)